MYPLQGFHSGGHRGLPPPSPILQIFLKTYPSKLLLPPLGGPLLKNEAPPPPPSEKQPPPPLKNEAPFLEMIPRKNLKKSETVINNCISIIKQNWKKMGEIPNECDFITWSNQNFVQKVKQFVKKYIT